MSMVAHTVTTHPARGIPDTGERRFLARWWHFAADHLLMLPLGAAIALAWVNTDPESYFRATGAIEFFVQDVAMVLFFGLIMKEVVEATAPGGVLHPWRRAKAINFGIIYGISAFGLANQLGIPREEAAAYIKKYFERFPGIRAYMDATRDFCREHGYVTTLFGRKCHYPDIKSPNPSHRAFNERAAINARLQGSAADIIRRAMARMDDALAAKRLSAWMLLQVHDELIFEVPNEEVAATLPVVQHVMQDAPFPAVLLSVPLQVDARAADNWDEAH